MCDSHGTSACRSVEASLKGSMTVLKRLRTEAEELSRTTLEDLRAKGHDTAAAELLLQEFQNLLEKHHVRASNKLAAQNDAQPVSNLIAKS